MAMKKIIFSVSAFLLFGTLSAQTTETTNTGWITFTTLEHNYGTIEFNANGTCEFEFTNTGKDALILSNVQATCGCIRPDWSKVPLKPGDKGKITVKYNTQIPGPFQKQIRVYSNATTNPVVLVIKGEVKPQAQPQVEAQKEPNN
jgi:hypothetical protein